MAAASCLAETEPVVDQIGSLPNRTAALFYSRTLGCSLLALGRERFTLRYGGPIWPKVNLLNHILNGVVFCIVDWGLRLAKQSGQKPALQK